MVIVKWFNMFEEVVEESEKLYTIVSRGHDDFWDILESSPDAAYLLSNWYFGGELCDEDKELHIFALNDDEESKALEFMVDALNFYNWKICGNEPIMFKRSYLSYLKLKRENYERELCDNWETFKSFIYPKIGA